MQFGKIGKTGDKKYRYLENLGSCVSMFIHVLVIVIVYVLVVSKVVHLNRHTEVRE